MWFAKTAVLWSRAQDKTYVTTLNDTHIKMGAKSNKNPFIKIMK